jgi:hypothetical protein
LLKAGFLTVLSFDSSAKVAGPFLVSKQQKGNSVKRFETGGGGAAT